MTSCVTACSPKQTLKRWFICPENICGASSTCQVPSQSPQSIHSEIQGELPQSAKGLGWFNVFWQVGQEEAWQEFRSIYQRPRRESLLLSKRTVCIALWGKASKWHYIEKQFCKQNANKFFFESFHSKLSLKILPAIYYLFWKWKWSRSVMSDSLQPHGV